MSSSASAHLVYGFDLGAEEFEFKVKEAKTDKYGCQELILPWFVYGSEDDDVEDSEEGFDTLANEVLLKASGFDDIVSRNEPDYYELRRAAIRDYGVKVGSFNHNEYPRYALHAIASETSTDTSDVNEVSFPSTIVMAQWDRRLQVALKHLGITPLQRHPAWLLYPNYG